MKLDGQSVTTVTSSRCLTQRTYTEINKTSKCTHKRNTEVRSCNNWLVEKQLVLHILMCVCSFSYPACFAISRTSPKIWNTNSVRPVLCDLRCGRPHDVCTGMFMLNVGMTGYTRALLPKGLETSVSNTRIYKPSHLIHLWMHSMRPH